MRTRLAVGLWVTNATRCAQGIFLATLLAVSGCGGPHQLRVESARLSSRIPASVVPSHTATVVIQPNAVRWLAPDRTVLNERVYNLDTSQGVVLFTSKHAGFSPPAVRAIEEVAPTGERLLVVTAPKGEITARFPFERLSLVRASERGRFIVTHGNPAPQGLPPGPAPAPLQGRYIVYDASGTKRTEQGESLARHFQDVYDEGLVIDVSDSPGSTSRTLRLIRVDGSTVFEKSITSATVDAVRASFTEEGAFVVLQVTDIHDTPSGFEITVWDQGGVEWFRFASALPGEARSAGTNHLLVHEVLSRARHRFHLVEIPAAGSGRIVGSFEIGEAVQQFWGRFAPGSSRLLFIVHYRDRRGRQQWRLQSRDPTGQRRNERRLNPPDPMLAHSMLRSYGDGVHWIVADNGGVQLLTP